MHADVVAPLPASVASLPYIAPEIVAAAVETTPPIAAATAEADIWALGVVMLETVTDAHAFPPSTPSESIRAALTGDDPLPWEHGAEGLNELLRKLGRMHHIVLPCLSRNPQKRPSATSLLHAWNSMADDVNPLWPETLQLQLLLSDLKTPSEQSLSDDGVFPQVDSTPDKHRETSSIHDNATAYTKGSSESDAYYAHTIPSARLSLRHANILGLNTCTTAASTYQLSLIHI